MAKHTGVFIAHNIQVILQYHALLCQGAGFVSAENINGAKILDGIQVLYDSFLFRHGYSAFCKAAGNNHRQHFGGQSYRDGNTEQERFQPVALGKPVYDKYDRHHDEHKPDEHPGHGVDAFGKAGFNSLARNRRSHGAKQSIIADRDDHCDGAAADYVTSHECNIGILCNSIHLIIADFCKFFHRCAFARQGRLTDKQILRLEHSGIRRNHITGRKMDDITNHRIGKGNFLPFALLPVNGAGCSNHAQEFFSGIAGARFLHKA